MSVIARQSFKYSIVGYSGTIIGILATVFMYPNNLAFAGKLQFIFQTALLFLPIVSLGIIHANVRFFPKMSPDNKQQDLLKYSVFFIFRNFLLALLLLFFLGFIFKTIQKTHLWQMGIYILPITLLLALLQLLSKYISIKKRIVVPNLFENFLPKLGMVTAFACFVWGVLSEQNATFVFVFSFILALIGMLYYCNTLENITPTIDFSFLKTQNFKKELLVYSFYTFLGSMGSVIALNIDTYMIGETLSFQQIAIYNTALNLVRMVTVPALGVYTISAPIIAGYIANNQIKQLQELHHKTSFYLFVIGTVLFAVVAIGVKDLFVLIKNGQTLSEGIPIVYIMGFAFLFDLATGFNGYIITNSKYYKFNNTTTLALAFLTIITNLIFLFWFKMGIIGVSLATAISLTIYNLIKIYFNYKKFKIHPFSYKFVTVLVVLILVLVVGAILPNCKYAIVNLFYKPTIALLLFVLANRILKIIAINDILKRD